MQWFKHATSSHDDPDISDAEDIYGDAGYTVFFKILEIYGQEYTKLSDGELDVSCKFIARKLRKSWTKVEKLLNFYQERQRIFYKIEYGRVKIKIPKFIELASNWTSRNKPLPTEAPTESPTAKEVEVEEKENRKEKKKSKEESWRSEYEIYKSLLLNAVKEIYEDSKWKKKQENYYPNIDIMKSLEKSLDYWLKIETWEKMKKKRKGNTVRIKSWITDNFDKNRIYKVKQTQTSPIIAEDNYYKPV